ncbi:type VI secretion system baseplate subunit TssK [Helicobacter saguini]|uniref:Type VI secretion system baseplate subunit TssK n=1 Tax=Helicobacter saguini TaxID=1548018 RepID=A0A099BAS9_9HELI|nr:type VI secretion system baseplate subunit TssK [Helicobacter saguini]MWV62922.1 type VI secretion system baseplate subunit TssK [Helicobacter saguini]MWV66408.1 type VI secretion system baseplate subunit TssK [Helicobacter saguini]MWV68759.1 type VI secretion system baseplate subunit TssK [Helicobacter saguini]MWV71687.1 type VI secretion system baseplate subunit TssK [Helicobacter saguini]TLD91871.1 type VI secretion system baseplate subunit TssK [Helicobacter saguini]
MADNLKVAWINGMSIDKVHFEQQERYLQRVINQKTIALYNHFYGILHIEIANDLLSQGKIALQRISGIAQDGSVFNSPDEDLLPQALEITSNNIKNPIITLKIQTSVNTTAELSIQNALQDSKYITTQALITSRIHDEMQAESNNNNLNTSYTQEKISVILASLRLTLGFLGNKSPNELEIPICKIKNIDSNNAITLDYTFIPTCFDVSGVNMIESFIDEIIHNTKQHADSLNQIFRGIDMTKNTLDFTTYLSLNLLKKWNLIFQTLKHKGKLHPEYFYDKLIEFQADLSAFGLDSTSNFIQYNHNDLSSTFIPLINNLRISFAKIIAPKYILANVIDNKNGFFDCIFDNAGIIANSQIFFAIKSDSPIEYLQQNFKSQSKILTQSKIKNIVASQLKGVNIEQLQIIPSTLPHLNGYVYYKIDKNDKLFSSFYNENIISFYITKNIINPDIKMWAVL